MRANPTDVFAGTKLQGVTGDAFESVALTTRYKNPLITDAIAWYKSRTHATLSLCSFKAKIGTVTYLKKPYLAPGSYPIRATHIFSIRIIGGNVTAAFMTSSFQLAFGIVRYFGAFASKPWV